MSKSIVKACVKYNDRLYTGFEHGECFRKLNEDNTIIVHSEIEQGFVDNDGNFVDRKQAMIIAKESGQLTYENDKKTLISEDLHLNWLNKQAERIAELEEQLKNAIVPKFEIGQEVWFVNEILEVIHNCKINAFEVYKFKERPYEFWYDIDYVEDNTEISDEVSDDFIFATKEEAQAKLEELRGE